jgi:hypothetical protein
MGKKSQARREAKAAAKVPGVKPPDYGNGVTKAMHDLDLHKLGLARKSPPVTQEEFDALRAGRRTG